MHPTEIAIPAADLPAALTAWLAELDNGPLLMSLERLPDERWVFQALPEADPALVARVRVILGQYEDVLRRLT